MVFRVDARSSQVLADLITALATAEKPVQAAIRAQTRKHAAGIWQGETQARASSVFEARLASTARAEVSNQNVTLAAAKVKGQKFSNGLDLRESWSLVERGADREKVRSYQRNSPKGNRHQVKRRTMRQFKARQRGGYVLGPAQRDASPRILSLWVQTGARALYDHIEGK